MTPCRFRRRELVLEYVIISCVSFAGVGCERSQDRLDRSAEQSAADAVEAENPAAQKTAQPAESADAAVMAVIRGFRQNRLDELWQALPLSYQADINDLVHAYARKMDAELWRRIVATVRKAIGVLKSKKSLLLDDGMDAADPPNQQELSNWDEVLYLLDTVANSELSDLQQLQKIDVGKFLIGTGSDILAQLRALVVLDPNSQDPFRKLDETTVELISAEAQSAVLRRRSPGEPAREEHYVRIEGKWIPKSIAESWNANIQQLKAGFAVSSPEQDAQKKEQILQLLSVSDDVLDQLANAQSSEQFQIVLSNVSQVFRANRDHLAAARGNEVVVTLVIQGEIDEAVEQSVRDLAGKGDFEFFPDGDNVIVKLGSVQDVQQLADRIDFGTVKDVDIKRRLIKIELSTKSGPGR